MKRLWVVGVTVVVFSLGGVSWAAEGKGSGWFVDWWDSILGAEEEGGSEKAVEKDPEVTPEKAREAADRDEVKGEGKEGYGSPDPGLGMGKEGIDPEVKEYFPRRDWYELPPCGPRSESGRRCPREDGGSGGTVGGTGGSAGTMGGMAGSGGAGGDPVVSRCEDLPRILSGTDLSPRGIYLREFRWGYDSDPFITGFIRVNVGRDPGGRLLSPQALIVSSHSHSPWLSSTTCIGTRETIVEIPVHLPMIYNPSGALSGFTFVIDPNNDVAEPNETNNTVNCTELIPTCESWTYLGDPATSYTGPCEVRGEEACARLRSGTTSTGGSSGTSDPYGTGAAGSGGSSGTYDPYSTRTYDPYR